jgi:hypothetical protein
MLKDGNENRVLMRMAGSKENTYTYDVGEHCIMRGFISCTLRSI